MKVELNRKILYELDGGDRSKVKSFKVKVEPSAITVRVPRDVARHGQRGTLMSNIRSTGAVGAAEDAGASFVQTPAFEWLSRAGFVARERSTRSSASSRSSSQSGTAAS